MNGSTAVAKARARKQSLPEMLYSQQQHQMQKTQDQCVYSQHIQTLPSAHKR